MNLDLQQTVRKRVTMKSIYECIIETDNTYISLQNELHSVEHGFTTLEQLVAIQNTVKQYGCTESLLSLYGDNDIEFSVEGVGSAIMAAIEWLKKKITELVTAIKNFFKQLFSSRKKVEDKIKEAKNVVARVKVKNGSTSSEAFDPKSNAEITVSHEVRVSVPRLSVDAIRSDFKPVISAFFKAGPDHKYDSDNTTLADAKEKAKELFEKYKYGVSRDRKEVSIKEAINISAEFGLLYRFIEDHIRAAEDAINSSERSIKDIKKYSEDPSTAQRMISRQKLNIQSMTAGLEVMHRLSAMAGYTSTHIISDIYRQIDDAS